ncbi:TPA: amino acid ABC transporter substrate-binding protein, partial [Citrobacter freundii]|nr:amino acid ABC transporter substrate-binding protein [Citrobacter freundii]
MSDILRLAWRMLVGIFLLMVLEMPCMASTPQQLHTLEQIASKKTITLGYQDDAFPFSWQNGNAPAGYSIDICNSIVSALKTKLQLK